MNTGDLQNEIDAIDLAIEKNKHHVSAGQMRAWKKYRAMLNKKLSKHIEQEKNNPQLNLKLKAV